MIIRRYYPRGFKGKTYSEEYLAELEKKGVRTDLIDTARTEFVLSREEQEEAYARCENMVLHHTRWVLDNLEHLSEFRVNWCNYGRKHRKTNK